MVAAGNDQLHPSPASPNVFSITGHHCAIDLLCLTETWHDADSTILGRLRSATYTMSSIMRDRVQLTTCRSTTAASPFSPILISHSRRSTLPISRPRLRSSAHVPVLVVSLRSSSCCYGQARSRCSSSRRSLSNWCRWCSALNSTLRLCIISYRIAILCVISYRIGSLSLRAISCQH